MTSAASTRRRARGVALVICLLASVGGAWGDRPSIVVVTTRAGSLPDIDASLGQRSFSLGAVHWQNLDARAYVASATSERTDAELFDVLEMLRARSDVIAAGELLSKSPVRTTFFAGELLVRFRSPTSTGAAHRWGTARSLLYVGPVSKSRTFRFRTDLRPAALLSLQQSARGSSTVEQIDPIIPELQAPPGSPFTGTGAYQRTPKARNKLAVLASSRRASSRAIRAVSSRAVGSTTSRDGMTSIISFQNEKAMLAGQQMLQTRRGVTNVGPIVSEDPLAFLTDQLVVRFRDDSARVRADMLLTSLGLIETGPLPYIENGYMFRYPEPSYEIYVAARQLIVQDYALYAIPNLASVVIPTGCVAGCGSGLAPTLEMMEVCEPWSPQNATDWPIKVGLLDSGILDDPFECQRLNVDRIVDFGIPDICVPTGPWCNCSIGIAGVLDNHGTVLARAIGATTTPADSIQGIAQGVPIINALKVKPTDLFTDQRFADALVWLAGGTPGWCWDGTNYKCPSDPTFVCDPTPGETICPDPWRVPALGPEGAAVINLSMVRDDFIDAECPEASSVPSECQYWDGPACSGPGGFDPFDCNLVCEEQDVCGLVDQTLTNLTTPGVVPGVRPGGAVIVNSVGSETNDRGASPANPLCFEMDTPCVGPCAENLTDLALHEGTIAVGAVREVAVGTGDWRPTSPGEACFIQHRGDFLDVVAPTQLESSAAAALVTGVVALMLRQAPEMPAAQVKCLLRETARQFNQPGEMWNNLSAWDDPNCCSYPCDPLDLICCAAECNWANRICGFNGDHSDCLGHGMVSACGAAAAAEACVTNPSSAECLCTEDGVPKIPCESSVVVVLESPTCNTTVSIVVTECDDPGDPAAALSPGVISSRTTIQVIDRVGHVADMEASPSFTQPHAGVLRFVADDLFLTDATARDPGNGVLDVREGDTIRVIYRDEAGGVPQRRVAEGSIVWCRP